MTTDIHKVSTEARAALQAVSKAQEDRKAAVAKNDSLIAQRNAAAKPLIAQVFKAIEGGEAPEGCETKEAWARLAKHSLRNINHILRGRPSRAGQSRDRNPGSGRRITLKEGMPVRVSKLEFDLTGEMLVKLMELGDIQEEIEEPEGKSESEEEESMHPAAADLEKTLDVTEAITVTDENKEEQCDYTEDEVAAMFAGGGE